MSWGALLPFSLNNHQKSEAFFALDWVCNCCVLLECVVNDRIRVAIRPPIVERCEALSLKGLTLMLQVNQVALNCVLKDYLPVWVNVLEANKSMEVLSLTFHEGDSKVQSRVLFVFHRVVAHQIASL